MSRLTKRAENGAAVYATPSGDPVKWENNRNKVLRKLADYEDLEEKGLLLKLPCKVGDTVYLIDRYVNSREWYLVYGEHRVTDILLNENREPKVRISNTSGSYELSDFGKKVFLTKEETAKAWRRLNEQREWRKREI